MEFKRTPEDKYIIMGCDGVWERYTKNSQGLINKINKLYEETTLSEKM